MVTVCVNGNRATRTLANLNTCELVHHLLQNETYTLANSYSIHFEARTLVDSNANSYMQTRLQTLALAKTCTCKNVHLQKRALAKTRTCKLVHLQTRALANSCTCKLVHLHTRALATSCTCNLVHLRPRALANSCTCKRKPMQGKLVHWRKKKKKQCVGRGR